MDFRLHNNVGFILVYVGFILLLRQIASCLSLPIGRAFIPKNVYSRQIRKEVDPIGLPSRPIDSLWLNLDDYPARGDARRQRPMDG
jgi:hypothetical protein